MYPTKLPHPVLMWSVGCTLITPCTRLKYRSTQLNSILFSIEMTPDLNYESTPADGPLRVKQEESSQETYTFDSDDFF